MTQIITTAARAKLKALEIETAVRKMAQDEYTEAEKFMVEGVGMEDPKVQATNDNVEHLYNALAALKVAREALEQIEE